MRIRDPRTNEIIQTTNVNNAVWQPPYIHEIFCNSCQKYFMLKPVSLDEKATHWECSCRCLHIEKIRLVFDNIRDNFKQIFLLHKLEYSKESRYWEIESSEFISPNNSRLNSHRRLITMSERTDLLDNLRQAICDELSIEFDNFQELLAT
jgi:uncharacterized protein YeeX (DUF496 family)